LPREMRRKKDAAGGGGEGEAESVMKRGMIKETDCQIQWGGNFKRKGIFNVNKRGKPVWEGMVI